MAIHEGGTTNDDFSGGADADTYTYGDVTYAADGTTIVATQGFDTIVDTGGYDTLRFGNVASLDYLYGRREGDDFAIYLQPTTNWSEASASTTLGGVRITNFFAADGSGVLERVDVQSGYALLSFVDGVFRVATYDGSGAPLGSFVTGSAAGETIVGTFETDEISGEGGDDTLYGEFGDDVLSGGEGSDRLVGGDGMGTAGSGNDRLDGGNGGDILAGEDGDDWLIAGADDGAQSTNPNDILDGGDGFDTADYSFANGSIGVNLAYSLFPFVDAYFSFGTAATNVRLAGVSNIERFIGSAFADSMTGDANDNLFHGGGGNDVLDGGDGNDTLRGGAGADMLIGGNGIDTADYSDFTTAVNANLATLTLQPNAGGGDTLSGIENVIGGSGADNLTGNAQNNRLEGGAGADSFFASGGNDTFVGGSNVGGVDYISYNGTAVGTLDADFDRGTINKANGTDTLSGIEGIGGSLGADRIYGDVNNNFFRGRAGDDYLDGRGGVDTLAFDMDTATVCVWASLEAGSSTTTLGGLDVAANNNGNDNFKDFENLRGTHLGDDLIGDSGNNRIEGGRLTGSTPLDTGSDTIYGRAGNDTLLGGGGGDFLYGEEGRDTLVGGAGNDLLDGGPITDPVNVTDGNIADYTGVGGSVVLSLQTKFATNDGLDGQDTLPNINQVIGGNGADSITGSDRLVFEILEGGPGADALDGGAFAADDYYVVSGNRVTYQRAAASVTVDLDTTLSGGMEDSVVGSGGRATGADGSDTLSNFNQVRGSAYADFLYGSDRTDVPEVFEGDVGDDLIDGRGGLDYARYDSAGSGVRVDLRLAGLAQNTLGAGTDTLLNIEGLRGSEFADVLLGGNTANDALEMFRGQGGNDVIDGGSGFDRVEYSNATAAVIVTLGGASFGSASDGQGGSDELWNIEAVRGSLFGDTLTGSDAANEEFDGRQGDDLIDGGGGSADVAVYGGRRADFVVTLNTDGSIRIADTRPARDGVAFEGTDTVRNVELFRFLDGTLTQNELFGPPNQAPTTSPVTLAAVAEDSGARLITQAELLANAQDVDSPTLTAVGLAIAEGGSGTLLDNLDGTWSYTPDGNDDSAVSFNYLVSDGSLTAAGTATLDITPVNDAPTSRSVTLEAIAEDSGTRVITAAELLVNVADADDSSFTVSGLSASSGLLDDMGDGFWNFTPEPNDNSAVSFSYTITDSNGSGGANDVQSVAGSATLDITSVNDAPTTSTVTLAATAEDSGTRVITQVELLANARDVDSPALSVTDLAVTSGNGFLVDNVNGTWTYTPALNDDSQVSFSYAVTDGTSSVAGSASLDITPVNDAPVVASFAVAGNAVTVVATDVENSPLVLAAPFASAFAAAGTTTGTFALTAAAQASALSGTLQVSDDAGGTAAVFGLFLGTDGNNTATVPSATLSNVMYGFDSNDSLTGGSQSDWLTGGFGRDTLVGGAGDDTVQLANGDFVSGESIDGGTGTGDRIALIGATTVDLSIGSFTGIEALLGSDTNDIVSMLATQATSLGSVNLGGGADVLNVIATGSIAASTLASFSAGTETIRLVGTGGNDLITLTGAQLDAILTGTGAAIDLGGGTADAINLTSTSADLNALGGTNAALAGVESISAASASAGVTIRLTGQSEGFTLAGSANADAFAGGSGVDLINGGAGADRIGGGGSNDQLVGGAGGDTFFGGTGNDALYGGGSSRTTAADTAADTFVFNTPLSATTNVDTIYGMEANGLDRIFLDGSVGSAFRGSGASGIGSSFTSAEFVANAGGVATTTSQRILYDTSTGTLYYDADGTGATSKAAFAIVDTRSLVGTVDFTDFTYGAPPPAP